MCTCKYRNVHVYMYIYMRMYLYIYIYIHVYVYMNIYIYTHMYLYTFKCMQIHVYIHIYVYVLVHVYICIHSHIYMCIHGESCTPGVNRHNIISLQEDSSGLQLKGLSYIPLFRIIHLFVRFEHFTNVTYHIHLFKKFLYILLSLMFDQKTISTFFGGYIYVHKYSCRSIICIHMYMKSIYTYIYIYIYIYY